jgi:hypothetical protein
MAAQVASLGRFEMIEVWCLKAFILRFDTLASQWLVNRPQDVQPPTLAFLPPNVAAKCCRGYRLGRRQLSDATALLLLCSCGLERALSPTVFVRC